MSLDHIRNIGRCWNPYGARRKADIMVVVSSRLSVVTIGQSQYGSSPDTLVLGDIWGLRPSAAGCQAGVENVSGQLVSSPHWVCRNAGWVKRSSKLDKLARAFTRT